MISTEQLSKAVYDKLFAEQQEFRKSLLGMEPQDILDQAYVYAVREDILCAIEDEAELETVYNIIMDQLYFKANKLIGEEFRFVVIRGRGYEEGQLNEGSPKVQNSSYKF